MAIVQNIYTGNGSTTLYSLSFLYLDEADVKVTLNGAPTTAFVFVNASTIQFLSAPANGTAIVIYRETANEEAEATFFAGSSIKAVDLNNNFTQFLYSIQELTARSISKLGDTLLGILNMGGFRITNMADPVSAQDAATKNWVETSTSAPLVQFRSIFYGAYATDPATDPYGNARSVGDLYFNSTSNVMRVWNGATWQDSSANANVLRWRKTAVGGETSLSGADDNAATLTYTVNLEFVYLNGVLLTRGADYTASNGTSITGLVALEAGDVVEVLSYSSFSLVNVPGSTIQDGTISTNKLANGSVDSSKILDNTIVNADVNASAGIQASKLSFTQAGTGAVARTVDSKLKDVVSVKDFGAVGDGVADDTAAIQAALSSGAVTIDGKGSTYKINSPLTLPQGVTLQNIRLNAGTAGMNMVLVNSSSRIVNSLLTGTGTTNIVERGVYPATDGVVDVSLDITVTQLTVGVQAQHITTFSSANIPKRWTGKIYCNNIVGATGVSEGYGLLLSPAEACEFSVVANTVARHAVYLSAGASYNRITATVDGCNNYAAQIFSTSAQAASQYNTLLIKCRNLGQNVAGQSGAVAIVQKANYNTVTVEHEGNNATQCSILVEGISGGPYPTANKIIDGSISGQFTGADVIKLLNADGTVVSGNALYAYATASVIAMRRSGTNGSAHGGYVQDNIINAQGQAIRGIYNECNSQPSFIGINEIRNNSTGIRVDDQTGGKRLGFSRRVVFSGTTASIAGNSSGDTTVTLNDAVATTGRRTSIGLTGGSGAFFNAPHTVIGVFTPANETSVTFRTYNGVAGAQTFNFEGTILGD
jgi:hypothetical protein